MNVGKNRGGINREKESKYMEGLKKYLENGESRETRKKENVGIVKKYLEEKEIKFAQLLFPFCRWGS